MIKYFNQDKWERAKKLASNPNDEVLVLEVYKKLGGAYEGILDEKEVKVEISAPIAEKVVEKVKKTRKKK